MAMDAEIRELPCKLSDADLLLRGDAMANCELAIDKLKDKRAKLSKRISEKRKERFDLAEVIERGEEVRDVRCAWIDDFTHATRTLVRQDTGEEIEQVTMTAEDRQLAMIADEQRPPGSDETIDLDDVPDDDGDPDDLDDDADLDDDDGDDGDPLDEVGQTAEPERQQVKGKARGRQPHASA